MKIIIVFIIAILCSIIGYSQKYESVFISGQVVAKEWCPLPGVTINIVDTINGTVTDVNGKFSILAPVESVMILSLISEPYFLPICDLKKGHIVDSINCVIRFNVKNKVRCKKPKGPIIKLDKNNRGSHIFSLVACYKTNFEKTTLKYYKKFKKQDKEIDLIVNGDVIKDKATIQTMNFTTFKDVRILKINPNKYIFVISKSKSPST